MNHVIICREMKTHSLESPEGGGRAEPGWAEVGHWVKNPDF